MTFRCLYGSTNNRSKGRFFPYYIDNTGKILALFSFQFKRKDFIVRHRNKSCKDKEPTSSLHCSFPPSVGNKKLVAIACGSEVLSLGRYDRSQ